MNSLFITHQNQWLDDPRGRCLHFFGLLVMWCAMTVAAPVAAQDYEVLRMKPGEALVMKSDFDLVDIVIGEDTVADVVPLSIRTFSIQAKTPGITSVILVNDEKVSARRISVVVNDDFSELQALINGLDPNNRVDVRNSNGRPLLSGTVRTAPAHKRAVEVANSYSPDVGVIDAIKVNDPRQVLLRVNILELSTTGGKDLGIDVFGTTTDAAGLNGSAFGLITGKVNVSAGNGRDLSIDYVIRALEAKGLAKRLANPTLVSINGSAASFVVGGEVPIVSRDADGNQSTTYREYGVKLSFQPELLDDRRMRLEISPEVSEVDWSKRVDENPAFVSRKVTTTVELSSGNSFAIAGLLQRTNVRSIRQFPWLGDIPLLGALFRSAAYQDSQTELVIIVTPYLVNENSSQTAGFDPFRTSGDPKQSELFLLGLLETNDEMIQSFKSGIGTTKPFGHIIPEG